MEFGKYVTESIIDKDVVCSSGQDIICWHCDVCSVSKTIPLTPVEEVGPLGSTTSDTPSVNVECCHVSKASSVNIDVIKETPNAPEQFLTITLVFELWGIYGL